MSAIEPNQDALSAMAEQNPDEPVYMLNLLKYRETAVTGFGVDGMSGREAYQVYGREFAKLNLRCQNGVPRPGSRIPENHGDTISIKI